jgi:osmotically-inducible protein OsmY
MPGDRTHNGKNPLGPFLWSLFMKHARLALPLLSILLLSACEPVSLVAGAGAVVGIAAESDEGISGSAIDLRIKTEISDRYFRYNVETFGKITVTVNEGRVLLTGIVQKPDERVEAVRLAWLVDGVKQVINEIRVADSRDFPTYVTDNWITARLRTALTFDADVHSIDYTIETLNGTVYLMGVARNQAELDRVIEIARTISNVQQVVSYVKLSGQDVMPAPASPGRPVPIASHTETTGAQAGPIPAPSPDAPPAGEAINPAPDAPQPLHPSSEAPIEATPLPP